MDPSRVQDRKPVHAGVAILQHSKLMLLHFVDFLRKYLVKGSYALVYGGKILHQIILYLIVIFFRYRFIDLECHKERKSGWENATGTNGENISSNCQGRTIQRI